MNLLLVWSHQAEIIIVKSRIQKPNNVAKVWIKTQIMGQGRRKKRRLWRISHAANNYKTITIHECIVSIGNYRFLFQQLEG